MPMPKYQPGQRVCISESASGLVPQYVGMVGHIGIGSISAPAYHQGEYFVTVRLDTGAKVVLRLPERCITDAPSGFHL